MLREVREDVGRTAVGKARSPNESAKQSDGRYAVIKVEPRVIVFEDGCFFIIRGKNGKNKDGLADGA